MQKRFFWAVGILLPNGQLYIGTFSCLFLFLDEREKIFLGNYTISKVQGTITNIAKVGERVEANQVLVQIDPIPFERAVTDAQLNLENAQVQMEGLRSNQNNTNSSLAERITNAELTLQEANRQVDNAKADLALAQSLFEIGGESAENVRKAQDALDKAIELQTSNSLNLNTLRESQTFTNRTNSQDLRSAELAVKQAEIALELAFEVCYILAKC